MEYELERRKTIALVFNDKENNLFTIYTIEKGGPIISDPDLDTAKQKFSNAIKLAASVRNLLYFEGFRSANKGKIRNNFLGNLLESSGEIVYREMQLC